MSLQGSGLSAFLQMPFDSGLALGRGLCQTIGQEQPRSEQSERLGFG